MNRKIDQQQATEAVSAITGLPFYAYYRKNCNFTVDAAYLTGFQETESQTLVDDLIAKTGLEFILEEHGKEYYLVLKSVNATDVQDKIKQAQKNPISN